MIRMYHKKDSKEVSKVRSEKAKKQLRDSKGRFITKEEYDKLMNEKFYFVATKPKLRR